MKNYVFRYSLMVQDMAGGGINPDLSSCKKYKEIDGRNTYDEEKGRKYSTYQYQLVFNEIYKFVNAMYAQIRNMKQSIHIEDMLTALPDTTKLNKDDNQWVRQDVDFDYNLWIDKMRHCLDSRNLYIFNQLMLGYDQKEIGKSLGCSHQAISQRVMKIKKQLQEKGLI